MRYRRLLTLALITAGTALFAQETAPIRGFTAAESEAQRSMEEKLKAVHYSLAEFRNLLTALAGRRVSSNTRLVVSTSRHNRRELARKGLLELLLASGVEVVADTCTYYGRQLGLCKGLVMTASAKWAVYAPGNLGVDVLFARLTDCVESAVLGRVVSDESFWSC
jgi:predicted aconitase